jgi:ATP/maltotriose-dependent transcriptional regulator MalT
MSWSAKGGDSLTKSESEVLGLVDSGLSNREIAATLSIAVGTVKCHLHRVYEKLQVRNRLQAVAKAREDGHFSPQVRSSRSYLDVTFDR